MADARQTDGNKHGSSLLALALACLRIVHAAATVQLACVCLFMVQVTNGLLYATDVVSVHNQHGFSLLPMLVIAPAPPPVIMSDVL